MKNSFDEQGKTFSNEARKMVELSADKCNILICYKQMIGTEGDGSVQSIEASQQGNDALMRYQNSREAFSYKRIGKTGKTCVDTTRRRSSTL